MKGFRGLLTILLTWFCLLVDTFTSQISTLSPAALKGAFLASIPITVKLIWTDAKPKIMEWIK